MSERLQFRVLYRQFLFRLMDVELLSGSAQGDSAQLLGQFASLLVFGSLLLAAGAGTVGQGVRRHEGDLSAAAVEWFLVSLTMLVVGVFALLNWDSTFPDRRDVMVLGPLPVRARTLLAAKVAAAASALGIVVVAMHCLSGLAWPLVLAPSGAGFLGTLRFALAFWITLLAAGAFLYCVVLGVQGLAAQLPRKWYLRVSPPLQAGLFVLFLAALCFDPPFAAPSHWFAVSAPPGRALAALAIAILAAGGAFFLSYLRMLRKIVEEPDAAPRSRLRLPLPRFGNAQETALAQFAIRTLVRSGRHRTIAGFYLGGGFAIVAVYLQVARITGASLLVASLLMLCAAWLGVRAVFSLPLDVRANWLFRLMPVPPAASVLAAARRALVALAVFPVMVVSAAILPWFGPWTVAAQHMPLVALVGLALTDVSLMNFHKIPFTCTHLPGKSKVHMVFWFGLVPAIITIHKLAELEQHALTDPLSYAALIAAFGAGAFAARKLAEASARRNGDDVQFEDYASDQLLVLGLDA